jgi:bacterioferritin-associated ferredoxin
MYVCICKAVTDQQIRQAIRAGVTDLDGLQQELGVASGCGSCADAASALINESDSRAKHVMPIVYRPALA